MAEQNYVNQYFKCAREKGCVGKKNDMKGFHACALASNCKTIRKKKKKEKKTDVSGLDMLANVIGSGRGGCKSYKSNKWITHVKSYQRKHGCTYRDALVRSKDTYR
jgi:hypothetical protein